jgi:hypothetical protein
MCQKFLEYIERFPLRARHVERLELSNSLPHRYDKRKLCTIFPNVRVVKARSDFYQDEGHLHQKPIEFTLPNGQIEELADYEQCELAYALIDSGLCSRLTSLFLDVNFSRDSYAHFIPSLKNMPALKKLTMVGLEIRIDDMETIHSNLPSLDTLELNPCEAKNSVSPLDIEPCNLKCLKMLIQEEGSAKGEDFEWMTYIKRKYPSLSELSIWNKKLDNPEFDGIEYTLLPAVCINRIRPQMKKIGPICHDSSNRVYGILDGFGARFHTIKINFRTKYPDLTHLTDSLQVASIEELHLSGMTSFPFEHLAKMTNLKKLYITGDISFAEDDDGSDQYHEFYFGNLLSYLPKTVNTLSINNVCLLMAGEDKHTFTALKELELENVELLGNYNKFIGASFPGLKALRLYNALAFIEPIELKDHDLSLLEITLSRVSSEMVNVSLTTMNNNTTKDYPVKSQLFFSQNIQPDLYIDHRNQVFPEPIDRSRFLQITCHSVKALVVNMVAYPS